MRCCFTTVIALLVLLSHCQSPVSAFFAPQRTATVNRHTLGGRPVPVHKRRIATRASTAPTTCLRQESPGNEDDLDRSAGLRQALNQVLEAGEGSAVGVGSTVVANSNLPQQQIWQYQSYTVQAIWDQGMSSSSSSSSSSTGSITDDAETTAATGLVDKIPRTSLEQPAMPPAGYTRFVSLYSAKHHENPVTVRYSPDPG